MPNPHSPPLPRDDAPAAPMPDPDGVAPGGPPRGPLRTGPAISVTAMAGMLTLAMAGLGIAGAFLAVGVPPGQATLQAWLISLPLAALALVSVAAVGHRTRALEAERAELARALEANPCGLAVAGPSGALKRWNPAWSRLTAPSRDTAGRNPSGRVGPQAATRAAGRAEDAADRLAAACLLPAGALAIRRLAGAAAAGRSERVEVALAGPTDSSGATAPALLCRVSVEPLAGLPDHALWQVTPLPDPLAAATAALASAPVGVVLADSHGRIRAVNDTLATWLRTASARLADGRTALHGLLWPAATDPGNADAPKPPPYALAVEPLAPVRLRRGGRDAADAEHLELRAVTALEDGPLGRRALTLLAEPAGEEGLRAALEQAERRFQRFFEFAPIGVVLVDAELRLIECNATFLAQLSTPLTEVQGRPIGTLMHKDHRARLMDRLTSILAGGDPGAPVEVRIRGHAAPVVNVYARRLEAETPETNRTLILHVVDVTDQKNLEVQFVQSQKMQAIGQLAGGVAHDFNNLLTAMIGFCDLLLLKHKPGDASFSDIMQIKQNANRAANLVRQLLAFSRQQTLQPRVLDVTDVIAELSNLLRRLIGENIELRMLHGRELGLVKVDQGQLEQVIINLVVNARDAMPSGGRVTVVTGNATITAPVRRGSEEMPTGDYVTIEVIDTGVGIPRENLERIFEPFFSTKEVGSGTGLGLSTVYGIVRQTGGFVFVDSHPGEGAKFSIYLPRHGEAPGGVATQQDGRERGPADLTGMGRILLVEDEDAVRVFAARALRNKGYHVTEAKSGEAALALLDQEGAAPVDLIVSDVVMPHMDGPTLIRTVRERTPDMKVIFISGYAEDRVRDSLGGDGAGPPVAFLPKPFSLKQLASKVKDVMAGS